MKKSASVIPTFIEQPYILNGVHIFQARYLDPMMKNINNFCRKLCMLYI
jgi:hypothetical protein